MVEYVIGEDTTDLSLCGEGSDVLGRIYSFPFCGVISDPGILIKDGKSLRDIWFVRSPFTPDEHIRISVNGEVWRARVKSDPTLEYKDGSGFLLLKESFFVYVYSDRDIQEEFRSLVPNDCGTLNSLNSGHQTKRWDILRAGSKVGAIEHYSFNGNRYGDVMLINTRDTKDRMGEIFRGLKEVGDTQVTNSHYMSKGFAFTGESTEDMARRARSLMDSLFGTRDVVRFSGGNKDA